MIYLIDDKKSRQETLGWNNLKFEKYSSLIRPVYSYSQIIKESLNSTDYVYSNESIILFHESFFDNVENTLIKDTLEIRNKLNDWSIRNGNPLVTFSGSNKKRNRTGLNVSLPVEILYQNLEVFISSVAQDDKLEKSLDVLLFGENFNIERILQLKKEIWETKFRLSPLLNKKIQELNKLTNKNIDLKVTQDPTILKTLINE